MVVGLGIGAVCLFASGVVRCGGWGDRGKHGETVGRIGFIDGILRSYRNAHGALPVELSEILPEVTGLPVRDGMFVDAWGNGIEYERGGGGEFLLRSAGEDGRMGTGDDVVRRGR